MTAASLLAVLCVAWWALAAPLRGFPGDPPGGSREGTAGLTVSTDPDADREAPLKLAAFRTPLWVAPPAPPLPPATPAKPPPDPPTPPLKWQLLAITHGPDEAAASARAMFYDPESDAVIELEQGREHAGRVIEKIAAGVVTIRQGKHTYSLSLDHPVSGGGGQ